MQAHIIIFGGKESSLWSYYTGNLGTFTYSGVIVKLPSNKGRQKLSFLNTFVFKLHPLDNIICFVLSLFGNLGIITYSGVIVKLPSNKG